MGARRTAIIPIIRKWATPAGPRARSSTTPPLTSASPDLAWSESEISLTKEGDELVIRLRAPLNFDYDKVETGTVVVTSAQGDEERVTVTEDSPNSMTFTARIQLQPGAAAKKGDKDFSSSRAPQSMLRMAMAILDIAPP